jgi:hypothetical protein
MNINASTIGWGIGAFVWCIFMGVTAISIGFGALYPPMNRIAQPFVCPNGQMNYEQLVSNPLPGTTYVQAAWTCVDRVTDKKTDLDIFPPIDLFRDLLRAVALCGRCAHLVSSTKAECFVDPILFASAN